MKINSPVSTVPLLSKASNSKHFAQTKINSPAFMAQSLSKCRKELHQPRPVILRLTTAMIYLGRLFRLKLKFRVAKGHRHLFTALNHRYFQD
jgi:hypothetical protein